MVVTGYFIGSATFGPAGTLTSAGNRDIFLATVSAPDTTAPTLVDVTMWTNASGLPPHVTTGTTVTLNFTADEPIAAPTVTMAGRAASVSGSGTTWQAEITVQADDPQGPIAFEVVYADLAGNAGTPATELLNGSPVVIDTIAEMPAAPALSPLSDSGVSNSDGITKETTLIFTGEADLEHQIILFDGEQIVGGHETIFQTGYSISVPVTEGTHSFRVRMFDQARNYSDYSLPTVVVVDTTAPGVQHAHLLSTNASSGNRARVGDEVTLMLFLDEPTQTPVVTIGGFPETPQEQIANVWRTPARPNVLATEGEITFSASITDLAGNTTTQTTLTDGSFVFVDNTAPVLNDVPADITTPAPDANGKVVTFTAPTATDTLDGALTVTCTPASGSTFPIGTTPVECMATDLAGNSATQSFNVTVTPAPVVIQLPDVTVTSFGQQSNPKGGAYTTGVRSSAGLGAATAEEFAGASIAPGDTVKVRIKPPAGKRFRLLGGFPLGRRGLRVLERERDLRNRGRGATDAADRSCHHDAGGSERDAALWRQCGRREQPDPFQRHVGRVLGNANLRGGGVVGPVRGLRDP